MFAANVNVAGPNTKHVQRVVIGLSVPLCLSAHVDRVLIKSQCLCVIRFQAFCVNIYVLAI